MTDKKSIINLLNGIADLMEYKGENIYKTGAYRNGAIAIRKCEDDLDFLIKNKKLDTIKGIGKSLQSIIYEFATTGKSGLYEELRNEVPAGLEQLMKVKGLSSKKIRVLYDELGLASVGELEYACRENKLSLLPGFGAATQDKILKEIENLRKNTSLILLNTGYSFAEELSNILNKISSVKEKEITGELRRGKEIISHIEFVLLITSEKEFLAELGTKLEYDISGNIIAVKEYAAVPISFHLTMNKSDYVHTLFTTTGSAEYLTELTKHKSVPKAKDEAGIFKKLKSPFVIPEMREHEFFGYKDQMNSDLETIGLKGLLHFHTTWSDGRNTLHQMTEGAKKRGYAYSAVCDHSGSAFYANGLNKERISLQYKEIRECSQANSFKILQGIESDILQDGSLDYTTDLITRFGFVVASIHSRFKMDEKSMTARMIKAIENPYTDLLAHPSGRLLLSREAYGFDIKKIIDACAANMVAIEINSNPRRLDLDWRHIDYARAKGVLFAINSDAHSVEELDLVKYGIIMGRKGGLQKKEVINYYSPEEFYKFVNRKVTRKNIW